MKSVFISSTSKDLPEHRATVKAVIERLDCRAIDMINFGSQAGDATKVSINEVHKGQIFIGIIAHRYGYVPEGMEKSVTEQEFDEAIRLKLPCLMYIVDPEYDWPEEHVETDEIAQAKLKVFKNKIDKSLVRSLFTTPENLSTQVATDLAKELEIITHKETRQRRILASGVAVVGILLFLILVAIFVTAPDSEKEGIAQANQQATNEANRTATALSWTSTPTPVPDRLSPGFNVIVAGFGFQTDDGTLMENSIADDVTNIVSASVSEITDIDNLLNWDDYGVGHILDGTALEREAHAAQLAEIFGADVVIYGVVSSDDMFTTVEPEFYITAAFAAQEPELIGADKLGDPVEFLSGSDDISEATNDFQNRLVVLRYFLRGLSLYISGDFQDSQDAFADAIDVEEEGLEVLYIFAGNSAIRNEDPYQAIVFYDDALSLRPNYSRALVGKGIAVYAIARMEAGDQAPSYDPNLVLSTDMRCSDISIELPEHPQLIGELTLLCYEEASLSSDQSDTADIDVKVAFGLGQTNTWLAINNYGKRWDDAEIYLNEVVSIYENSTPEKQSRVRASAAHANAWLGLRLLVIDGTDHEVVSQAKNYYVSAVDLLEQDVNRKYNSRWIDIYQQQIDALTSWIGTPSLENTSTEISD